MRPKVDNGTIPLKAVEYAPNAMLGSRLPAATSTYYVRAMEMKDTILISRRKKYDLHE